MSNEDNRRFKNISRPPKALPLDNGHRQPHQRLKRRLLDTSFHKRDDRKKQRFSKAMICNEETKYNVTRLLNFTGIKRKFTDAKLDTICRNETPIYDIGSDVMVQIVSFLKPIETFSFLTMPLSKKWCETYVITEDLWKILCISSPFHAEVYTENNSSRDQLQKNAKPSDHRKESSNSYSSCTEPIKFRQKFGANRWLYYKFIQCISFLDQIRKYSSDEFCFEETKALAILRPKSVTFPSFSGETIIKVEKDPTELQNNISLKQNIKKSGTKKKNNHSKLTDNVLGATKIDEAGSIDLRLSCVVYCVMNWMVTFNDVLGIQIMCLNVLPCVLEDEHQRKAAQHAGLADIVLKAMIRFSKNVELHTAAFHAMVLLTRPLGGREGMLFHQTLLGDSLETFNMDKSSKSKCCKNGIAIMLDSMRRFQANERLQAMSCWSIVNVALIAPQKTMLVKLDGISVVTNAMTHHPRSVEVQYRALFALINLSIPCSNQNQEEPTSLESNLEEILSKVSEKEILDESVGQVSNLVVVAMKNFCGDETVMNRACLVLHNLSLNDQYHTTLLWTPNCYQMLEWAMGNYRYDQVLQQSARGSLRRLQRTLRNNDDLRRRFSMFIRSQQQSSLDQARRDVQLLESQNFQR